MEYQRPLAQKVCLQLSPPTLMDNRADLERLKNALKPLIGEPRPCTQERGELESPLELMRSLPEICRSKEWMITVTLGWKESGASLLAVEPGDTSKRNFGLAVDIGTTTVVAYLVDLVSGETLGNASSYNSQISLGEDILTRIFLAGYQDGLNDLQASIISTLNRLIRELAEKHHLEQKEINAAVISGNTTMIHLLLALNPSWICQEPYVPVVVNPGFIQASSLGLEINQPGLVYFLPGVSSYLGGDVVAGVLVGGMHRQEELALFADIGTNGEIVLGNRDWLIACSGAAGPALEGGVVQAGMRAAPGAIDRVLISKVCTQGLVNNRVDYHTIGEKKPIGLCGSGLVDCLAELLLAGIIDRSGRFINGQTSFTIVHAAESATGQDISITQVDIDNLLRTKGAVNAALETLLASVGCNLSEVKRFYAAGAFGQHLNVESAITIGLYPDLPRENIICLGDSSGEGAKQVLLSREKRKEALEIAGRITCLELNSNKEFMNRFTGSCFLPHINLDYFPTVRKKLEDRG